MHPIVYTKIQPTVYLLPRYAHNCCVLAESKAKYMILISDVIVQIYSCIPAFKKLCF
jgi:hypothetical protein